MRGRWRRRLELAAAASAAGTDNDFAFDEYHGTEIIDPDVEWVRG